MGAAEGEHRWGTHAPDSEQEPACPSVRRCASGKLQFSLSDVTILQKSRMRRRARTDLCGGRFVRIVPTATLRRLLASFASAEPTPLPDFFVC